MGRGESEAFGGTAPRGFAEQLNPRERQALRLLAITLDDDYPGLLAGGDYGDDEFDCGVLLHHSGRTMLGGEAEQLVGEVEAGGLAGRVQAFRLLLASYDGVTDSNESAVAADVDAGLLVREQNNIGLTDAGLEQVQAELALLLS